MGKIKLVKAVNWNAIEDDIDKATWEKLTSQFWLDTRIPVSNDIPDWEKLTAPEKDLYNKVFGGLTLLDTLQGEIGNNEIAKDSRNQHELAVFRNIAFMEEVHAKSYSTIFSTLSTMKEIDEIFKWTEENPHIIKKNEIIQDIYENGTAIQKKVASVFLESFLFYSGFFTPLYYVGIGKMKNTAEIIKLILRDESVHGAYIGYKHKLAFNEMSEQEQEEHEEWSFDLLNRLYENEVKYTESLYDSVGLTEDVKQFLKYNADKSLMNLGFDTLFEVGREDINPLVMNGISTETANHDFFSAVGNGYLLGSVEAMKDDDYSGIKEKLKK